LSNNDNQIATLDLFNEKVKELLELSFIKASLYPNVGFSLKGKLRDDGKYQIETESKGPSDEAIKAFILTFRFFIQDNEKISLRNIAELYAASNIDPVQNKYFNSIRDTINNMLDLPNLININIDGDTPTNRKIMDVYVYGGLAHANPDKYRLYKKWTSYPPTSAMFQTCFTMILTNVLKMLVIISEINKMTIELLKQQKSA
jgi:hypothetical protein